MQRTVLALFLPFVLLALLCAYWYRKCRHDSCLLKRRLILSVLIVLYISYIGLARRLLSVLYCIRIHDGQTLDHSANELRWSQDTSVVCYEGAHAILFGLLTVPMILAVLFAFPLISGTLLIQARKKELLGTVTLKETFGFMFQAYKEKYIFWDCVILLRKAALALIAIFGWSLGGNMQGLIAVCILMVALYMQQCFKPFNESFDSLNSGESVSLLLSLVTFLSGVFLNDPSISQGGRIFFSILVIIANLAFVLASVYDIYSKMLRVLRLKLEMDNVYLRDEEKKVAYKLVSTWVRHQYSELASRWKDRSFSRS